MKSLAAIVAGIAIAGYAQESQFTHDASGNLATQRDAETGAAPQILSQPQRQVVAPGGLASFSVIPADARALTYQWRFNSTNLTATSDVLLITNASAANEGPYTVVLSNSFGSVTSAPAMLMIDGDGDGLADSWELAYFTNLNQFAYGDWDGDGVSNVDEFRDGTNPTDKTSALYRIFIFSDGGTFTFSPLKSKYTNGEVVMVTATPFESEKFHGWTGDAVSTSNQIALTMTTNRVLTAFFHYYTVTWTNTAGGDWQNPLNWAPNLVPAMGDTVVLNINANATNNSTAECGALWLGAAGINPSISGSGTITVHSNGVWTSGSMTGTGRTLINSNATFTINNSSTAFLDTRTLENAGTIVWTGSDSFSIQCSGAVITNRPGALFEVRNNTSFHPFPANSRFDNAGTLRKTVGTGITRFDVNNSFGTIFPFNNYGTTEVQTGTLLCNAAFVNNGAVTLSSGATMRIAAGGSGTGTFNNPAGALVDWTVGTFTVNPGGLLNGSGLYKISSGTVALNTDLTVQNLDLIGTLDGSGRLTISNVLNWTAGSMNGSGRTIIAPGATNYINNLSSTVFVNTRTFENAGTIIWTGSDSFSLQVSGAVVTNRPGALFDVRNNASFYPFPASSRFDNAGILRKSAGSGTTRFDFNNSFATFFPFNNFGTTEVQTGTLLCGAAFVNNGTITLSPGTTLRMSAGGSANGTFNNPASALVDWTGSSTFTVSSGALLNGSGLYRLAGGTVVFNTDIAVQNLDLAATLDGSGRLTVSNVLNWTAGNMNGSGRTIIAPSATNYINNLSSTVFLNSRTLENAGTIIWTGGDSYNLQASGAVITNRPGALFEVRNNGPFYPFPGNGRFDNAGTLRKTVGTGTTRFDANFSFGTVFPFNNYGTLEIQSGIVAPTSGYTCTGSSSLHCFLGGTNVGTGYGRLQANGTVALNGGLRVSLTNGFIPASNDTFTVFTAGSRNGAFSSFAYPSNVVAMQLSNSPTSVILRVTDITLTNGAPIIVNDLPLSSLVYDGRIISLPTRVVGGQPFTFQWQRDGTNLTNNARIAGANADTLFVTNALRGFDSGNYRLFITNSEGAATSRVSAVSIQAVPKFNASGAGWSLQGTTVPPMNSNNVTLTAGLGNTARNVFYNAPLYIREFLAQFVYVDVGGGGADGVTFCVHNDPRGAATLGGGGGGLGYAGITPSAALALNIYQPNTRGMSWRTNGTLPNPYNPIGAVNLASGNPVHVSLLYTGSVLKVTFVESNTANTFTTNLNVNIPAMVGADTAFVGFTGGDGGVGSTQVISNFTFVPITRVAAEPATNTVTLSWPASIGGYRMESRSTLSSTSAVWVKATNVIEQTQGKNRVTAPATNSEGYFRISIDPAE